MSLEPMSVRLVARLLALVLVLTSAVATAAEYVTYLHADVQGSPLLATDEQGQVVWQEEYEPWGTRQVKEAAAATSSRGSEVWYTGKEEEAGLGMYYYGARWYTPGVGAFSAVDPAGVTLENPRSFNRYAYANNNPARYVDPDGRVPLETIWDGINVAYDVTKMGYGYVVGNPRLVLEGGKDLAADSLALAAPYVPAGSSKLARLLGKAGDDAAGTVTDAKRATEAAKSAARSADDLLRPGGELIGTVQRGATPNIRTVSPQEFAKLQEKLLSGAKPAGQYAGGKGAWHELPGGGRVGVRNSDKSGVTLDIDLPGFPKGFKVHQQ